MLYFVEAVGRSERLIIVVGLTRKSPLTFASGCEYTAVVAVAKLADADGSQPSEPQGSYGFESRRRHARNVDFCRWSEVG